MGEADELLEAGAQALGLTLSATQMVKLSSFADRILEAPMNLVGYRTKDVLIQKGLLDGLALFASLEHKGATFADVGTGAGLPGIVFGILGMKGSLIEAQRKKARFLEDTVAALGLPLRVYAQRAEEVGRSGVRERADLGISRAVGELSLVLELTAPLVRTGGWVVAVKGQKVFDELEQGTRAARALGLSRLDVRPYTVPGFEDGHLMVVVSRKLHRTPKHLPRSGATLGRW